MKTTVYRERATGLRLDFTCVFAIAAGVVMGLAILDFWLWHSWTWLGILPLLLLLDLPASGPRGTELQIRDIFGRPIDEIAAKVNDCRDRALGRAPDRA